MKLKFNFIFGLALVLLPAGGGARAATPWEQGLEQIEHHLQAGLRAYDGGDVASADGHFADAYFVAYEASGLEIAVRQFISAKRNYQLEKMFRNLRLLVHEGVPVVELEAQIENLRKALAEDVETLRGRKTVDFFAGEEDGATAHAGSSPTLDRGAFLQSLLIILREGFEAILLIAALIAYLQRSGRRREIAVIYGAAALAVGASLVTAYAFQKILAVSPADQEVLEGFTLLLASAVLFYVSYWLISKAEARRWQSYIREKVSVSLGKGRMAALGAVAFLAVYREGAETVLFYQALLAGTHGASQEVWSGFAAGSLLLLLLFVLFRQAVGKLPLGPFFAATSGFLYYLAFVFAGKGIHELQEGGLVGDTPVTFVPHIDPLGIFPSLETLLVQSLFVLSLAVLAARWLWTSRGSRATHQTTSVNGETSA